jgi:hypothetical protein
MRRAEIVMLSAIAAAGLIGSPASAGSDLSGLRLADLHLSAITTVQHWAAFIYGIRPVSERLFQPAPAATMLSPSCSSIPTNQAGSAPQMNPDGSSTQTFCGADGRYATVTGWYDKQTHMQLSWLTTIYYPDGLREVVHGEFHDSFWRPGKSSFRQYDIAHTLSTGDRALYSQVLEFVPLFPGAPPSLIVGISSVGDLILADGRTAHFRLIQPRPRDQSQVTDVLDLDLPGGEHLQWQVPTIAGRPWLESSAGGTYTTPDRSVNFCLTRDGEETYTWTISDAQGLNGLFRLNSDFSGQGQAREGNRLEFLGRWDSRAQGTVLLADGQAAVAGPSAGAQAFGNLRFDHLAVANGPAPGFGG